MKAGLRDFVLRLGSEGVVRLCSLATFPLLARGLGREGYGVVTGSGVVIGVIVSICSLGLSYHVGRIVGRGESVVARRLLRLLLSLALGNGIAGAVLCIAASSWLNDLFLHHGTGAMAILAGSGAILAGSVDGILLEWLRQRGRFRDLSLIQAAASVFQLLAILTVIALGAGAATVVGCASAMQLLRVGCYVWLIRAGGRATDVVDEAPPVSLRRCIVDGMSMTVGTVGSWGLSQAGRLFLGDAAGIGGYAAAAALVTVSGMVGSACGLPLYPALVKAVASHSAEDAAAHIRRYVNLYQGLTLPVLAIGMVLADDAIRVIAGRQFHGLGPVCAVLLVAGWMEMAVLPLTYLTAAHGWASRNRNAQLLAAAVSLLLACILVARLGAAGVAVGVVAGQLASAIGLAWGLRGTAHGLRSLIPDRLWLIIVTALLAAAVASVGRGCGLVGVLSAGIGGLLVVGLGLVLCMRPGRFSAH